MVGRRNERIDFGKIAQEFSIEQKELNSPWRMAKGVGENGTVKLAIWKRANTKGNTQDNGNSRPCTVHYRLNVYRDGFEHPFSDQVVKLDFEDIKRQRIENSLKYLAHRSKKTITPDHITSGPADHHRKNNTLVEIFELRRNSFLDKIKPGLNRRNNKEKKIIRAIILHQGKSTKDK